MPNTLSIGITTNQGYDLAGLINTLDQCIYVPRVVAVIDGPEGTAPFTGCDASTNLNLNYTTIGGQVHATGFIVVSDTLPVLSATFSSPEPLGVPVWTDMRPLSYDALLGDTRFDIRGGRGDDAATGSDFGDQFRMGRGGDSAFGGDGNDVLIGGRGNDLLIGGNDDDLLRGGGGHDMLIAGPGDDRLKGGSGNDVIVLDAGKNVATGGAGNDTFIVETGVPSWVTCRDWANILGDDVDLLVFASFDSSLPTDFSGETLADLENGMIDDFQWRETGRGVKIQAGDSTVVLRGVDADEIDIDQILFTEQSAQKAAALFDTGTTGGLLGTTFGGSVYVEEIPSGNQIIWNDEIQGSNLLGTTFGGDILGFLPTGETVGF